MLINKGHLAAAAALQRPLPLHDGASAWGGANQGERGEIRVAAQANGSL